LAPTVFIERRKGLGRIDGALANKSKGFLAVHTFSLIEGRQATVGLTAKLGYFGSPGSIMLFEKAQGFQDNLARGMILTTLNFAVDKAFEFGSERYVHLGSCAPMIAVVSSHFCHLETPKTGLD
jgi:hypothetical protein